MGMASTAGYISTVNIAAVGLSSDVSKDKFTVYRMGGGDDADGSNGCRPRPYHHGGLREALLAAAETILEREGPDGLTLRAAARAVGASHTAPKNHFGDLTGLLSELAATGYVRFTACLHAAAEAEGQPHRALDAAGRAYVAFALANPGLFQLMFRSGRLDRERPALKAAMDEAQALLVAVVAAAYPPSEFGDAVVEGGPSRTEAYTVRAWSMVHGFAMLLLDDRLAPLLAPPGRRDQGLAMLDAMLRLT